MKKYKVSLVICVADDVRIKKMLDSVKEFCEVVVVINGGTNDVKEIVNSYKNNPEGFKQDFGFDNTGEEWDYCVQNPGRFESFNKLIRVGDLDYVTYQLLTLTVR